MPQSGAAVERLGSFSDSVFAVIIVIMVLELKPPEHPTFAALFPLWPTALSYTVSYQFIAIVWMNHHRLLRFANEPTSRLIWINFALLFLVSLVPFLPPGSRGRIWQPFLSSATQPCLFWWN
jgi:uncharacterized membrane protein